MDVTITSLRENGAARLSCPTRPTQLQAAFQPQVKGGDAPTSYV
ncbi:hypothetical protein THTE_2738 [Thermogutta terrifontis]|uniref:Uncharacterized protein n=1 Tax=Thermogutta terrifontis TaxID=1331910 RepID=A0A286RHB0_9BACT|nr:hypothetical protein THTE_2738 [Thermogutta terrifontis]